MISEEKSKKCFLCWAWLIVLPLTVFAGIGEFLQALNKVLAGHGLDYFTTMWGYQFNYIGELTFFIAITVLLLVAPLIYWLGSKDERSFKQKYGIKD